MVSANRLTISEAQAAEIIGNFESKYDLFKISVAGVSIWRLLRFPVASRLQNLPLNNSSSIGRTQLAIRTLRGLTQIVKMSFSGKNCGYIVKTYSSALRFSRDRKYWDIYFDDLLSACPGGLKWQFPNASGYEERERNASIPPQLESVFVNVIANLMAYLLPFTADRGVFRHISSLITTNLKLNDFGERAIRQKFSSFLWQARIYSILLRWLRPKFVIVADTGERALRRACGLNNIRFIELQHGIFSQHHPDSLPNSVLVSESVDLLLPDILATYGPYWEKLLASTLLGKRHKISQVGTAIIDHYRAYRKKNFRASPGRAVITLSTQGLDRDNLINFLQDFLSQCNCQFILNIKLHPSYDDGFDSYIDRLGKDSRVKIFLGKDNPNVYELIALSDLHISIASACHYDALGLGVPTVVIGLTGYELMSDVVSLGHTKIAMTPGELGGIISTRSWHYVSEEMREYYCKSNFVENLRRLIA